MSTPAPASFDGTERPRAGDDAGPAREANRPAAPGAVARISSDQLLAGATEVHIEHRGSIYRLKQTSLGKLILTK